MWSLSELPIVILEPEAQSLTRECYRNKVS